MTLNLTRSAFAVRGYCPSARLFEAAACGVPIVTDAWEGLEKFFEPGREIFVATTADDVVAALRRRPSERHQIACRARQRTRAEHTAARRALELVELLRSVPARAASAA
jgi:spore maturation protein CgeB